MLLSLLKITVMIASLCFSLTTSNGFINDTKPNELEDVSIIVVRAALETVRQQMELQLMGLESRGVYDGLSEEQITLLQEVLYTTPMDYHYDIKPMTISGKNREILEALVFGEAGDEGFIGQCLVAQCIRDTMYRLNTTDVMQVIKNFKYAGSIKKGTSQSCKDAVSFIFDNGGYVVKQRIIYFYAPKLVKSNFHESQDFVIEWGGHRFFDDSGWK